MRKNFRRLFQVLDRWKWRYVMSGAVLMSAIAIRSLEPKVLQIAVDNVIGFVSSGGKTGQFGDDAVSRLFERLLPAPTLENAGWLLVWLGIAYLVISVTRGGLLLASSTLTAASTEKAIKRLRDRLFAHIQKLPMRYFTYLSKGELIQRSTGDIGTIRHFIHSHIVEMARTLSIFGFSFLMMYGIHPHYALISIILSPLLLITSFVFFRQERKVWRLHETEADKLNTLVQENLNGIRSVQAFANEDYEIAKFAGQNRRKRTIGLRHLRLHAFFWPFSDFLVHLQITIAIVAGGYFTATQQITVGELIAFYAYALMIAWPMRQVGKILSKMGMALVAIDRIYEVLDAEVESQTGREFTRPLRGAIEFREVAFRYDENASENVLKGISFRIRPGEKVALIGPTGAGKSTIINLLVGLYDPDAGEILIDGQDIRSFSRQFLRRKIGLVLQTPFLFSTTVRENIAYADREVPEAQIFESARLAQVDHLQEVLPQGYDTLVGEKGVTLSGGQKQRVALARTLLVTPDILVLDDVTSAVDTETEHAIFAALAQSQPRKTTIIISHRVTSIQQADRILVVDDGRIVQEGSPASLTGMAGYYGDIHAIQATLEAEIRQETQEG